MRSLPILLLSFLIASAHTLTGPVTVSGLSSGGFMTAQMHVAFSETIQGAAVFAGGPYYCAQGEVVTALTTCMATGGAKIDELYKQVQEYSSDGKIDDYANLQNDKVYIFDGTNDHTVNPKVGQEGEELYSRLGADLKTKYDLNEGHGMPTEDYGVECSSTGSPFINNCNFYGAYEALSHLYGSGIVKGSDYEKLNIKQIPQQAGADSSMDSNAFAYVPEKCEDGGCAIHVVFHGCTQTTEHIGMQYVENTGYNEIAEASGIVLLYPQAKKSLFSPVNPNGCWDWYGYTNKDYANKDGVQMKEVYRLIQGLVDNSLEMTPVYQVQDMIKNVSK